MSVVADASFLVAAFAPSDGHNRKAWRWRKWDAGIIASPLALFEAENTLRGFPAGGKCIVADARHAIEGMKRAILEGLIASRELPLRRLLAHSRQLSQHYTTTAAYGAMDILHVATALELAAKTFLTFDKRQGELASAEGLDVQP